MTTTTHEIKAGHLSIIYEYTKGEEDIAMIKLCSFSLNGGGNVLDRASDEQKRKLVALVAELHRIEKSKNEI